jgi:hypothetical protein
MAKLSIRRTVLVAAVAIVMAAGAVPARAYAFADCLWDLNTCRNDRDLFLSLAFRESGLSRPALEPVLPRVRYVSADLPVILFLTRTSGRPVDVIVDLRSRGLTWTQVFRQLGIGYEPLFVDFSSDLGSPYRTSWIEWRRSPTAVRLTDVQVRDLVQLQLAHRLAGVPVVEVARARARGRSPVVLVAEKHGRSYAAVGVPPGHGGVPPGHGGVPPGQVKTAVPPGHRRAAGVAVVPRAEGRREVKVKTKTVVVPRAPEPPGHAKAKGEGKGEEKGRGEGKGKGRGEGKGKERGEGGGKGKGKGGGHGKH